MPKIQIHIKKRPSNQRASGGVKQDLRGMHGLTTKKNHEQQRRGKESDLMRERARKCHWNYDAMVEGTW